MVQIHGCSSWTSLFFPCLHVIFYYRGNRSPLPQMPHECESRSNLPQVPPSSQVKSTPITTLGWTKMWFNQPARTPVISAPASNASQVEDDDLLHFRSNCVKGQERDLIWHLHRSVENFISMKQNEEEETQLFPEPSFIPSIIVSQSLGSWVSLPVKNGECLCLNRVFLASIQHTLLSLIIFLLYDLDSQMLTMDFSVLPLPLCYLLLCRAWISSALYTLWMWELIKFASSRAFISNSTPISTLGWTKTQFNQPVRSTVAPGKITYDSGNCQKLWAWSPPSHLQPPSLHASTSFNSLKLEHLSNPKPLSSKQCSGQCETRRTAGEWEQGLHKMGGDGMWC